MLLRRAKKRAVFQPSFVAPQKKVEEPQDERVFSYTKSEINGMRTADLQELGLKLGISDAEEKTGGTLKQEISEMLNL